MSHGTAQRFVGSATATPGLPGERDAIRDAWVQVVSDLHHKQPFKLMGTFTFEQERQVHPERALKLIGRLKWEMDVRLYGRNFWRHKERGSWWSVAWEPQKRGQIHLHSLMSGPGLEDLCSSWDPRRQTWRDRFHEEWWHDKAGIARLELIKSVDDVNRYCTKYVTKGGSIDFLLPPSWSAVQAEPDNQPLFPTSKEQGECGGRRTGDARNTVPASQATCDG